MLFLQLRYFEIAQDILGHLLRKTNLNFSYFELNYVFWEHTDCVGRETTVYHNVAKVQACVSNKVSLLDTNFSFWQENTLF